MLVFVHFARDSNKYSLKKISRIAKDLIIWHAQVSRCDYSEVVRIQAINTYDKVYLV